MSKPNMVVNMIGNHRGIFVGNNQILDFDKICRLCCAEASMLSVFKVHIHKKITACTGIQVGGNGLDYLFIFVLNYNKCIPLYSSPYPM